MFCYAYILENLYAYNYFCRSRQILDDFREAYYWLSQNTDNDARVMSWWDYGYQIAGMANRTTLVDNNTWNNSHIALVSCIHNIHNIFSTAVPFNGTKSLPLQLMKATVLAESYTFYLLSSRPADSSDVF